MINRKRALLFLISIPLVLLLSTANVIMYGLFVPAAYGSDERTIFHVQQGEGGRQIAKNLKEEGLIRWEWPFHVYAFFNDHHTRLQSGYYILSPSMPISEIVPKISSGDVSVRRITIIEGWNLRNIAEYFSRELGIDPADLYEITGHPLHDYREQPGLAPASSVREAYAFLQDKPSHVSLEGYLFPDTYLIGHNDSPERLVRRMLSNFDAKVTPELRGKAEEQGRTLFEVVTMASMLEKEVPTKEDKQIVAGILWKRLEIDMPLQVDATVAYITGKRTVNLTQEDLRTDSPYNTRRYGGMPLGPIANPGIESIEAALDPIESPYWYYLSKPDGETVFSSTLEEHNAARAMYLQ